ncbi:response regulator [Natrinema sp. HArc-T2]|uniref:response regulator n=1 Tax=Natrinema sp. HArc-T2 TaxID=3242701 RepID=UPI00359E3C50
MAGDTNTVLVADDDPAVAARLRSWLAEDYRVVTTTDGDETLALLEDADAVLVDPALRTESGSVVAAELERRATAQTVAVLRDDQHQHGSDYQPTAGDSLTKPVDETQLLETVDSLVRRARYDELIAECTSLATKHGALETGDDLTDEDHETVQQQLDDVFSELDELVDSFDSDDFRAAFATCEFSTTTQPRRASEQS